ncbi:hypothetical protein HanLR1_Chr01g0010471 [Helianthus annuus]|nr:hypothetical protein HanLR1_Chr01g0010471 [Helianthus annuus]
MVIFSFLFPPLPLLNESREQSVKSTPRGNGFGQPHAGFMGLSNKVFLMFFYLILFTPLFNIMPTSPLHSF